MNTEGLFITRKRKKWKFAHFDVWENCFQLDDVNPQMWPEYFGNSNPLTIEIGAGTANIALGLAEKYPNRNFVALDIKSDRLYTGAKQATQKGLKNVAFVRAHMNELGKIFAVESIAELWVTFPDPFPRDRSAKHRLTHQNFLETYQDLLAEDGRLRFKTDNRDLFLWSLEQLVHASWNIVELGFDLHESDLPEDYKITTYYEQKFMAEGTAINYVTAIFPEK